MSFYKELMSNKLLKSFCLYEFCVITLLSIWVHNYIVKTHCNFSKIGPDGSYYIDRWIILNFSQIIVVGAKLKVPCKSFFFRRVFWYQYFLKEKHFVVGMHPQSEEVKNFLSSFLQLIKSLLLKKKVVLSTQMLSRIKNKSNLQFKIPSYLFLPYNILQTWKSFCWSYSLNYLWKMKRF